MRSRLLVGTVLALALGTGVAACSSDHGDTTGHSSSSAAPTGTAGDIAFAQLMIPHHEQAIDMADMALTQAESRTVRRLARQIEAAQDPEIQQMQVWLSEWGAPAAMPSGDHSGHDMGGMSADGMMSAEDMAALAEASGAEFDTMWLEMMIDHHEGAVEMAEQVKQTSSNPDVIALADSIISAQEAEIETMAQLLAG